MRLKRKGGSSHTTKVLRSFPLLQLFFLLEEAEFDFRDSLVPSSITISTCTPNGHHHSCSSGVVRSGTPWITTEVGRISVERFRDRVIAARRGRRECRVRLAIVTANFEQRLWQSKSRGLVGVLWDYWGHF